MLLRVINFSYSISFVSIGWKCAQIFRILEHFVNKCKLSYVSPQWLQFGCCRLNICAQARRNRGGWGGRAGAAAPPRF